MVTTQFYLPTSLQRSLKTWTPFLRGLVCIIVSIDDVQRDTNHSNCRSLLRPEVPGYSTQDIRDFDKVEEDEIGLQFTYRPQHTYVQYIIICVI